MSDFTVRNPGFREDIERSFARQGVLALIGAELDTVEPGLCRVRLPITPNVSQHHGHVHGGVLGMIGDVAGGYAAMSLFEPGHEIVTIEYKINFLAPARGETLWPKAVSCAQAGPSPSRPARSAPMEKAAGVCARSCNRPRCQAERRSRSAAIADLHEERRPS